MEFKLVIAPEGLSRAAGSQRGLHDGAQVDGSREHR